MKLTKLFGRFDDPVRFDQVSEFNPACERGYFSSFAGDLRIHTDGMKNALVDEDPVALLDIVPLIQKSAERLGFLLLAEMAHSLLFVSSEERMRQQALELIGSCEVLLTSIERGLHGLDEASTSDKNA